jgi:hypothetical protein
MDSFRIGLIIGSSNYNFFDPAAGLNLSIGNPVSFATKITPMILRGLKFKTLRDLDNVIDLTTGTFKTAQEVKEEIPATNTATAPASPNLEPPKSGATEPSITGESKAPEAPVDEAPADDKAVIEGEDKKPGRKTATKK